MTALRFLSIAWIALLVRLPSLTAQANAPGVDSLISRVYLGDAKARAELGSISHDLIAESGTHPNDATKARSAAAAALAMAWPLSPVGTPIVTREVGWRQDAVRAMRRALAADSADLWSAATLERIAPYPNLWLSPEAELAHFWALARRGVRLSAALLFSWIRLELEVGSVDQAARAFNALPRDGGSISEREHLRAEIAFAAGDDAAGVAAYWRGAAALNDSSGAVWYSHDVAWIATPSEVKEWNALAFSPRVQSAWLQKFWNRRDLADGKPEGSRLREQFGRWRMALRAYRWEHDGTTALGLPEPKGWFSEYNSSDQRFPLEGGVHSTNDMTRPISGGRVLDDRGRIAMRLGVPERVLVPPGVAGASGQNILWLSPQGPIIVGFSTPSEESKVSGTVALPRYGMIARSYPVGDLMASCQIDSRLCAIAARLDLQILARRPSVIGSHPAIGANYVRTDYARMRDQAFGGDASLRSFDTSLGAILQAFGIEGGGMLLVFAVPVEQKADGAASAPAMRIEAVIGDSSKGEMVGVVDTLYSWQAVQSRTSGFRQGFVVLPSPIGSWSLSVVIGDTLGKAGTGIRFRDVPVIKGDDSALELSDPILGREGSGLSWRRGDEQIPLNPTNAWRADESVILNYEMDGMTPGHSYQTRYELWKADGKPSKPNLVITANAVATTTRATTRRELAVKELSSGDYRLVVRVKDGTTGVEVVRERRIAVRK